MRTKDYFFGVFLFLFFINFLGSSAQSIEGYVTHGLTGEPLQGAEINCFYYLAYTGSDGYYNIDGLPPGNIHFIYGYGDLCPFDTTITISVSQNIELDVQLFPCPEIIVEPLNIEVTLEPGSQSTEIITITNPGDLEIEWNAELEIMTSDNADDFLDVQFQYPLTGPNSYAGIECDGEYFYLSNPYSGEISKYTLDGTFVEAFMMIPGLKDLAFDGTYFYGGNGSNTIFQMDFYSQVVVSTFSVSQNVRAIAYDHDEGVFYGYNWGGDIFVFDQSGATLGSMPVGSSGANFAGFAYDNVSEGGPYLWGYGLVGTDPNFLVQIQLPSLQETGLILNLNDLLPEPLTYGAGGLFTHPDIFPETWTLGGVVQDEWMWGLELTEESQTWISIEPASGVLDPGESEEMNVYLDATNVLPWSYDAEIQVNTFPNAGSPLVEVTMMIEGKPGVHNMQAEINCTNVILNWETNPPNMPTDSFHVYKDSMWVATTSESQFIDSLLFPEIEHSYFVTAYFFNGWESNPTNIVNIIVPFPDSLEPTNLNYIINDSLIVLSWEPPDACLAPDEYNLYIDGSLVGFTTDTSIQLPVTPHEYIITAVYYFGESGPSNSIVITKVKEKISNQIQLFPNPVKDILIIQSPFVINWIEIFNLHGAAIFLQEFESSKIQLCVSQLETGIYFLNVKTDKGSFLKKMAVK